MAMRDTPALLCPYQRAIFELDQPTSSAREDPTAIHHQPLQACGIAQHIYTLRLCVMSSQISSPIELPCERLWKGGVCMKYYITYRLDPRSIIIIYIIFQPPLNSQNFTFLKRVVSLLEISTV